MRNSARPLRTTERKFALDGTKLTERGSEPSAK
jgi:hypothetical protein